MTQRPRQDKRSSAAFIPDNSRPFVVCSKAFVWPPLLAGLPFVCDLRQTQSQSVNTGTKVCGITLNKEVGRVQGWARNNGSLCSSVPPKYSKSGHFLWSELILAGPPCLGLKHVYESPHKDGNARCVCARALLLKLCACSFVNTAISILIWIKMCELHPLPGEDEQVISKKQIQWLPGFWGLFVLPSLTGLQLCRTAINNAVMPLWATFTDRKSVV